MIVVLSAAYMNGRSFCPASNWTFCWRLASGVDCRLIGIADAAVLQEPAASLLSSAGVCVSSVVNRMEKVEDPEPDADPDEPLPPELEHAPSTSAHTPMPAAAA